MNKLILMTMLSAVVLTPLFGMESNENNQETDKQLAKLACKASKNLKLGHKFVYLGSLATEPDEQKNRIIYAYKKFEDANNYVGQIKDRLDNPERKKE